jgi:hypothetical protein
MSVQVNLLPPEVGQRARARRVTYVTVGVLLLYVAALATVYLLKVTTVNELRAERDDLQAQVALLEARRAELQQYAQLAAQLDSRNQLLSEAMRTEISWSRVLNDLSLAFPATGSMETLAAASAELEAQPGAIDFGPSVAEMRFTGYSVEHYAPGVESVLVKFDEVRSFFNVYLSVAGRNDRQGTVATEFNASTDLDDTAYTNRYANGLPPEVAQ